MPDSSPRATQLPPGIRIGSIVANRYRIEEVVGRGGMGIVVAARHLELGERVAVKFMSPDALSDPEAIARFDREVRAAARLRSEYIARVYDAGKLPDGGRYMVLEYLEGEDLSIRVHRDGPLELESAIRFILQASSAVLEAHVMGIIHRDLKPANLRVVHRADGSEIVKVLDFGVMKRIPSEQSDTLAHDTQPGTIIGTPLYTSPEQLRGMSDVDVRSDIWSLGATLFELLAGRPPFGGKTYPQVIANVLESAPPTLRSLRADIPPALDAVVARCLEKRAGERYGSIVELAQALSGTVSLDPELTSLLERMVRMQKAPTKSSPGSPEPIKRSDPFHDEPTPAFAVVASSRSSKPVPVDQQAGIKEYAIFEPSRRRMLFVVAPALASTLIVVTVGLPWLPRFDAKPKDTTGSASASAAKSITRSGAAAPIAPAATSSGDLPGMPPPALVASGSAQPVSTIPQLARRRSRPADTSASIAVGSAARPREQDIPPTAPSTATTLPRKNPLLVRPR